MATIESQNPSGSHLEPSAKATNWENPRSPLLRVLPLHLINLGHAGIAHRCDIAFCSDGYEILRAIQQCIQPRKLHEQLPLPVWHPQTVDSGLFAASHFGRAS